MNKCIISFNCAGGVIYNKLNKPYSTPFVGHMFRSDEDFLKFCLNLLHYLNAHPLPAIPNHPRYNGVSNKKYVVTRHDDIEIHWIHDFNTKDVVDTYNYRKLHMYYIDKTETSLLWNRIVIVFSETCLGKDKKDPEKFKDFIIKFSKIRFRKVFFSSKEINIEGIDTSFVKVVPKWKDKKFWEKCGEDFNCRNGTCPGCGRTSYGNYGGVAEQYIKLCL